MNYVKQLSAFLELSTGKLNAKEQAMYLRLFKIANELRWREWFEVADSQLMRELMISSRNTIKVIREKLVEAGFIQVTFSGTGRLIKYHLVDLENGESGDLEMETCSKKEHPKIEGCSKIEQVESEGVLKNCAGGAQKMSRGCSKIEHIINYKHKHTPPPYSLESQHSVVAVIEQQGGAQENELPQISPELKREYENKIFNAPKPEELEKIAILERKHTAQRVKKAINVAAQRGKHSADYVAGILNRSMAIGYVDLDGQKNRERGEIHGREKNVTRYTGQREGESPEEYVNRLNVEYSEADRNQAYLRHIQPYTGGTGGT